MKETTTKWESKDRTYILTNGKSPLTYKIRSSGLLWFDEETNENRELRYATNQKSLFMDEQDDHARLGHIIFEDGALYVPKSDPLKQQLLSLYHPQAGSKWEEVDDQKKAEDLVDLIELELEAQKLVQELDIEHLEAIMRTELGSSVAGLTSKELKRDAYSFARNNPTLFMEVAKDSDIKLRNLANRSVEMGILTLTDDNTVFRLKSNGKKIMTIPFDQHPYGALAQYFKTDEGVDLMKSITKKLA